MTQVPARAGLCQPSRLARFPFLARDNSPGLRIGGFLPQQNLHPRKQFLA